MGFFNDFIRGATPALPGGMQIGLQGMAEMQRKKELQDEIARQQGQQAFLNMMKQREMDQGQQNWQREFDANNMFKQQQGVDDLSQLMMQGQQQLVENRRADKLVNAQASNLGERRAPTQEEFLWNQMTPEQQQEFINNYTQNKFKPAGGSDGGLTPANAIAVLNASRPDQFSGVDTTKANSLLGWIGNKVGGQAQVQPDSTTSVGLTSDDQEALNVLKGLDPTRIDWEATIAKNPNLNWQAIMQAMGAK